ncbi:MAG: hypothetical protein AAB426_11115 [Myxococcota bacterium]
MTAKLLTFDLSRRRKPCLRSDRTLPVAPPRVDALAQAFAALDGCPDEAGFTHRVELFRRAFRAAVKRSSTHGR